MRRSSVVMLIAAVLLGLIAVLFARFFLNKPAGGEGQPAVQTVSAVVATADIKFGEKLTTQNIKAVEVPAATVPQGTFQNMADLTRDDGRVAMRSIAANEVITETAVSGRNNRLSTSQLLGPNMRAITLPVTDASGIAGLVYPGDRVDVFLTRNPEEHLPYADLLVQNVRVLAVNQDMNVGKEAPEAGLKVATIEVTPLQAQKITLAQSVGTVNLALRQFQDESRVRLETVQIYDLNDGTVTRMIRKPSAQAPAAAPSAPAPAGAPGPAVPRGPSVEIFRGTDPTRYAVPGA